MHAGTKLGGGANSGVRHSIAGEHGDECITLYGACGEDPQSASKPPVAMRDNPPRNRFRQSVSRLTCRLQHTCKEVKWQHWTHLCPAAVGPAKALQARQSRAGELASSWGSIHLDPARDCSCAGAEESVCSLAGGGYRPLPALAAVQGEGCTGMGSPPTGEDASLTLAASCWQGGGYNPRTMEQPAWGDPGFGPVSVTWLRLEQLL